MGFLHFTADCPASSVEADVAEPSSEQSPSGRTACPGSAPSFVNAARTATKSYGDQRVPGETDCQGYCGRRPFFSLCF